MENQLQNKPRILCLHGFRTSAEILKKLVGKWPETVLGNLDLVFLDAPFPAQGKSDVEGLFDPPYYEWFQSNQDFTEYINFEECLAYIEDYMLKHGPFHGLLGFSQGAILAAALPGMQTQGVALTKVPKIKFLIIISGAKFGGSKFGSPKLAANAFSPPIPCPSLHFIGETDFMKQEGTALLESFVDPVVIHHPRGHTVPRLGPGNRAPIHPEDLKYLVAGRVEGETDFMKQEGTALLESFVDPVVIHHPRGHTVPGLDEKAQETVLQFIQKIWSISLQEE